MKLYTILLTIICVLGYAMYAEGRLGSPAEIQRRRLKTYSYGGTTYNAGGTKQIQVVVLLMLRSETVH